MSSSNPNMCTKSRNNQRKVAKAKEAGDEEEVERLRKERYDYVHKDDIKQEKSSNSKFGVGLLFGAVLGAAAVYGVSQISKNNDEEKKWKHNRN